MKSEQDIIKGLRTPMTECYITTKNGERVIWIPPKNDAFRIPGIGRIAKPMVRMVSVYEINTKTDEIISDQSYPLSHIKKAVRTFLDGVALEQVAARTYEVEVQ